MKRKLERAGILAAMVFAALVGAPAGAQMIGGSGPSVLSRGGNAPGMRGDEAADVTFYAGANGYAETGIYTPNSEGTAEAGNAYGVGLSWGAYGMHSWRRSVLGVDYRGDYRYYTVNGFLTGSNQAVGVEFQHTFNRHWQMSVRESGGTTNQPFGGFTSPSYVTSDYNGVPLTEIYNTRIYYTQTTAYAAYNWSARTIFTFGGGGFFNYRSAAGLVSGNGAYAVAGGQHRLTRDDAVGFMYQYQKFWYPRTFGGSDTNTVALSYNRNLGRYSTLFLSGGGSRVETLGSESYALSPEIQAILGISTGTRVFYRVDYIPYVNASITYRKKNWGYNAGFNEGVAPGNGVYLTSQQWAASGGASYTGIRKTSFGLNASYTHLVSLWQTAEPFSYVQAGGGMSYAFGRGLNFVCQVDWRNMTAGTAIYRQRGIVATAGISYSSSTIPLSLW